MGKVSKEKELLNISSKMDNNIPNSNYNFDYNSVSCSSKQQPAKISVVCDWSRNVTNRDGVSRVSVATKRKGGDLIQTKTKKLPLSLSVDA